ncbi:MAG: hypothetical protein KDE48_24685 [Anaerolineales bacterium]|nr:hypothetical protein [Anaerolineales bacterium]
MVKKGRIGFFVVFLFLITACRGFGKQENATPTPFIVTAVNVQSINQEPITISLNDLAANPEFFKGTTLHLTGNYHKLPKLICNSDPHPSPVTWGLVGDGLMANAGGLDSQLRPLLAEGQLITAEGNWRQWNGPVGCGKSAPIKTIWYLAVNRIIDPHPLVRITATAPTIAELPPQPATLPPVAVTQPVPDSIPTPSVTVIAQETAVTATSTPIQTEFTPTPTVDGTLTEIPNGSSTATIQIDGTPSSTPDGTATPQQTGTPDGSGTPTGTPGSGTPQATGTTAPAQTIDKGVITPRDLSIQKINVNETHSWRLNITTQNSAVINIAPASADADIVVSFIGPNGQQLIDNQNISTAGVPEIIENINLATPGQYILEITTNPSVVTDYALLYTTNEDDLIFEIKGRLLANAPQTAFLDESTDHFWLFNGGVNDTITIEVDPSSSGSDPYLELYDPDGVRIMSVNDGNQDATEILADFDLTINGPYTLRVGEYEYAEMEYEITITR